MYHPKDQSLLFIFSCIVGLLVENLLETQTYWPKEEELPDYLRAIPVVDDVPATRQLSKPCIGFQCAIERHNHGEQP